MRNLNELIEQLRKNLKNKSNLLETNIKLFQDVSFQGAINQAVKNMQSFT